jgi:hypothetical protein
VHAASVLTVASTSDWNASIGSGCQAAGLGQAENLPLRGRQPPRLQAAFAGNELCEGLCSGMTSSHRAFSKYGIGPSRLMTRAIRKRRDADHW